MIPLCTSVAPQRMPWANYALIGINVVGFAYELILGPQVEHIVQVYGWIPANFSQALQHGTVPALAPLLLCMFLHGGWMHLFGNLLYLYIFGGNVEDRLGHGRYVLFYCVGGALAILIQTGDREHVLEELLARLGEAPFGDGVALGRQPIEDEREELGEAVARIVHERDERHCRDRLRALRCRKAAMREMHDENPHDGRKQHSEAGKNGGLVGECELDLCELHAQLALLGEREPLRSIERW